MATEQEILDDISAIYKKIDQCYASKTDLDTHIQKSKNEILELELYIKEDKERLAAGKRLHFDAESMNENIARCGRNIELFQETMRKEDQNIQKFHEMIKVLQEDMKRPKEITIDVSNYPREIVE